MYYPPNFFLSRYVQLLSRQPCTLHRRNKSARNRLNTTHWSLVILNTHKQLLVMILSLIYTSSLSKNPKLHLQRNWTIPKLKGYNVVALSMIAALFGNLVLEESTLLQLRCSMRCSVNPAPKPIVVQLDALVSFFCFLQISSTHAKLHW